MKTNAKQNSVKAGGGTKIPKCKVMGRSDKRGWSAGEKGGGQSSNASDNGFFRVGKKKKKSRRKEKRKTKEE